MIVSGIDWMVVTWPTAGHCFPGQCVSSAMVQAGRTCSEFGRPRDMRSSAGRSARLGRGFSIEPPGPVFAILAITPFLLIQMRPFQLRWKVNSLRARRELVLMKSIE
ncbi:unnamed protein product [Microthlaspi erraticum]|uniref:Uncharacterized protein n=1 Tax=Microthlaspi erraticum TaxID=1685480 RepID=A0A6D2JGJ5_9BRAS|nr:unnamed protein product [Microthlaspi erraticum]